MSRCSISHVAILFIVVLGAQILGRQAGRQAAVRETRQRLLTEAAATQLAAERLRGLWQSVDHGGYMYFSAVDPDLGIGTYRLCNKPLPTSFGPEIRFKVIKDDPKTQTVLVHVHNDHVRELSAIIGIDLTYSVAVYRIANDGKRMTQEVWSTSSEHPSLSIYEYVGPEMQPLDTGIATTAEAGPRIVIDAISSGSDAFIMVDGHTYRKGEQIKGYKIVGITPQKVVLERRGTRWDCYVN